MDELTVGKFMSENISYLSLDATVQDALSLFETSLAHHLPVVNEAGQVEGILSDRDKKTVELTLALFPEEQMRLQIRESAVTTIMKKEVLSVFTDTPLIEAAKILIDLKIGALPVIEKKKLVGMLSYTDILAVFAQLNE